jgi:hypothetical protein
LNFFGSIFPVLVCCAKKQSGNLACVCIVAIDLKVSITRKSNYFRFPTFFVHGKFLSCTEFFFQCAESCFLCGNFFHARKVVSYAESFFMHGNGFLPCAEIVFSMYGKFF